MIGFALASPCSMVASTRSPSILALFLLAGTAPFPAAQAAEKAPPARATTGAAAPKTAILTPAQLQQCVNQKERLQAQTDDALKDKAAIEADKAEIERSGASLAEEQTTLDKTSEAAVDAYNAKVDQRNKLIDTYQSRVTAYNTKAETVKATKDG